MRGADEDRDDADIPKWLKWLFIAINRVGFPIVAFMFMCYICFYSMRNMTEALTRQGTILDELLITIHSNHDEGKEWRQQMMQQLRDLKGSQNF